jgi:tRNA G18 (ribose-2'-O)-methylase SpoU
LQRLADLELTIPMAAEVDSLNVGAATAVLLYAAGGLALSE